MTNEFSLVMNKVNCVQTKFFIVMNKVNCVQTKFLSCHFSALGQFCAKSNHSIERSDILLYDNHLSFVEILFTGPKFKGKEGYPIGSTIADQSTYWLM